MKKVIYILGAGRSGTTLLDIILGSNPTIFSGGELNRFAEYGGKPVSIDNHSETALFWEKFRTRMPLEWQEDNFRQVHKFCKQFEYHTGIFKSRSYNKSVYFKEYNQYIQTFFDTLSSFVSQPILIDSSKYPLRGYFMSKILKYDIAFIYLKRNPVDVVRSFEKKDLEQPSKNWINANLYLFGVNITCLYIYNKLKKNHKTIAIKYDDLISNPETVLKQVGDQLNIDVSKSLEILRNNESFTPGLLFDGNRIRLEKNIFIKPKKDSKHTSGLKDKFTSFLHRAWWNNQAIN